MRRNPALEGKFWLVLAVLAGCGGRSTQSGDPDGAGNTGDSSSGGSTSSTGGGSSIGARSSFDAAPSRQGIVDACRAICEKAQQSACRGFDHDDCVQSCGLSSIMVSATTACAIATLKYIYCVDDLPDVCAVLADDPLSTRCDQGAIAVGACLEGYCDSVPPPIECVIAN